MPCVNVLRTWVARFKRSLCSLGTTCHTMSWFIYFAYDVCVANKFDRLMHRLPCHTNMAPREIVLLRGRVLNSKQNCQQPDGLRQENYRKTSLRPAWFHTMCITDIVWILHLWFSFTFRGLGKRPKFYLKGRSTLWKENEFFVWKWHILNA